MNRRINLFEDFRLNESKGFDFKTKISDKDVDLLNLYDSKLDKELSLSDNWNIEWEMQFDLREFGIKSISPIIKKIVGSYTIITADTNEEEFQFDSTKDKWEIETNMSSEFDLGNSLYPDSIEVDFKNKQITVFF